MTRTQTGDIKTGFVDGMSWGLGFQVVKTPMITASLSAGTYGHGGAYATQSWADPKTGRIVVLMIQRAGFRNGDNSPVRERFRKRCSNSSAVDGHRNARFGGIARLYGKDGLPSWALRMWRSSAWGASARGVQRHWPDRVLAS